MTKGQEMEITDWEIADLGDVNELAFDVYVQARTGWVDPARNKNHAEAKAYMIAWDAMMRGELAWDDFEKIADRINAARKARVGGAV